MEWNKYGKKIKLIQFMLSATELFVKMKGIALATTILDVIFFNHPAA